MSASATWASRTRRPGEPRVIDWAVATIGGDAALAGRAREALTREMRRLLRKLDVLLDPGDERAREGLAHLVALAGE